MAKGHYLGGGSLLGFGTITKTKGRRGGIGTSGTALRAQRRVEQRETEKKAREKIKANEKIARQMSKEWTAGKGRKQYEMLVLAQCVKKSPLAAALEMAMNAKADPKAK
jgi:hypothetical protein